MFGEKGGIDEAKVGTLENNFNNFQRLLPLRESV
jgi:hypothetical protein